MVIIHHGDGMEINLQSSHLLKLELQLGHDLHLDPGLGRALVVQHVFRPHVLLELSPVVTASIAARPLAQSWGAARHKYDIRWSQWLTVAVEGVGVGLGRHVPVLALVQDVVVVGSDVAALHLLLPLPPGRLFCLGFLDTIKEIS